MRKYAAVIVSMDGPRNHYYNRVVVIRAADLRRALVRIWRWFPEYYIKNIDEIGG